MKNLVYIIIFLISLPPLTPHAEEKFKLPENITKQQYLPFLGSFENKLKIAESGDAETQYIIGMMYLHGLGLEHNKEQAVKLISAAASNGHIPAMFNIAAMYMRGLLVEKDESKARAYIEVIDDIKNPELWMRLSDYFATGIIGKVDKKLSLRYLIKAAGANHIKAMEKMAYNYRSGGGMLEKDIHAAIDLYGKIYDFGEPEGKRKSALILIGIYSTGKEIEQDRAQVVKWLKKLAIDLNDTTAQLRLAYIYRDGTYAEQDYGESLRWFELAAANKNLEAITNIGYFYEHGLAVDQDYQRAIDNYYEAATRGSANAAWRLSEMYVDGRGVEQNPSEADKWYKLYEGLVKKRS